MQEETPVVDQDFMVSELLAELKAENQRKALLLSQREKTLKILLSISLFIILAIVSVLIWYLNQYDFFSEQNVSGVYTLVDSDGNTVAQDITPEEYQQFMKEIDNGQNKN